MIHLILDVMFGCIWGLLLAWANGSVTTTIAVAALFLGTISAHFFMRSVHWQKEKRNSIDKIWLVIAMFFVLYHSLFLLFVKSNSWHTLSLHNFGDLPLHITIIKNIGQGVSFWPQHPIWSVEPLRYHFALDLYNGLWDAVGVPLFQNLNLTFLFSMGAIVLLIWQWLGWLGLVAIIFSGGWYLTLEDVAWKNLFLSLWTTQRGFLLGLPLGLMVLRHVLTPTSQVFVGKKGFALLTIIWAFFPFLHTFSFVVMMAVFVAMSVVNKRKKELLSIVVSAPIWGSFLWFMTAGGDKASAIRMTSGWMHEGQNSFVFWNYNFGPWFYLWIVVLLVSALPNYRKYWWPAFFSAAGFIFSNYVLLAPWEGNNLNYIVWMYILMVCVLYELLKVLWHKYPDPLWQASLSLILGFSGLVVNSNIKVQNSVQLYEYSEIWSTEKCLKDISRDHVFAAYPTFNHPLGWTGHKMLMGYQGHLWSYGIDYSETEKNLNSLLKGEPNWESVLTKYKIKYIFWGQREIQHYGQEPKPWMERLNKYECPDSIATLYHLDGATDHSAQ